MRDERPADGGMDLTEQIQALQGEEMPIDQDAVLEPDEFEQRRQPTRTELDHGAHKPDLEVLGGQPATLDGLAREALRTGETDDAVAATEEGLAYVPPVEPTAAFREPADRAD